MTSEEETPPEAKENVPGAWGGRQRLAVSRAINPEEPKWASLSGLKILVVEDEFLVALEVESALKRMGCSVVGPFGRLEKALEAAGPAALDGAVLDINLGGEKVYPLAELLAERHVPFIFLTGYAAADLPEEFRSFPRLSKPLDASALLEAILELKRGAGR